MPRPKTHIFRYHQLPDRSGLKLAQCCHPHHSARWNAHNVKHVRSILQKQNQQQQHNNQTNQKQNEKRKFEHESKQPAADAARCCGGGISNSSKSQSHATRVFVVSVLFVFRFVCTYVQRAMTRTKLSSLRLTSAQSKPPRARDVHSNQRPWQWHGMLSLCLSLSLFISYSLTLSIDVASAYRHRTHAE